MSAAPMAQTPVIPPRPSRSSEKEAPTHLMPQVPPRPVNKRLDRSISPGADRFAPSPLTAGIPSQNVDNRLAKHYAHKEQAQDPIERASSVDMPSLGEEGMEYSAVAAELEEDDQRPSAPEQTRLVGEGLKLHAPKPSLPAQSAKQQVMAVTRTDSDKAASFGIGQPSNGEERAVSRSSTRKRPESIVSSYSDQGNHTDEDHGIPEIGQRVPMNRHLGDVQAPSPGPEGNKKHHSRKLSGRSLPPGSYGLHGHGVVPQDKLEKAYYQKHPEALQREQQTPRHERHNDFAMSSSDLNRLVRDTANRHARSGSAELRGTPTDDVAFEASEKYTTRMSSSRPTSVVLGEGTAATSSTQQAPAEDDKAIHVDDGKNPEFYSYGEGKDDEATEDYTAPILASDELRKDPSPRAHQPAIRPHLERHGSSFDGEDPPSRPTSRPRMQRYHSQQQEVRSTPLEDVEEYDPLFPEDGKGEQAAKKKEEELADENCERRHFPSKDIWEDAPNSVHYTAEVSTPDVGEPERRRSSAYYADRPITPAQAFALYQEELAEKEASKRGHTFLPLQDSKPTWANHQPHLQTEVRPSSSSSRRFPSRDIWEDAPESHIHEAEVSASPVEQTKPEIPVRPTKKPSLSPERPVVPGRPKGRQNSGDDATKTRPPVSDKPKPSIPPRPVKSLSGDSKDGVAAKPKPPVPSRPAGGKIAALQAGFMSDLNKRLQLGPQGMKKEETPKEEEAVEEKEKVPLSDARKGRARGPQRRAPAKSPAAAVSSASEVKPTAPVLSFTVAQTVWSIDPEDGDFAFSSKDDTPTKDIPKPEEPSPALKAAQAPAVVPEETKEVAETSESVKQVAESEPVPKTEKPEAPVEEPTVKPDVEEEAEDEQEEEAKEADEKELTLASNTAGEGILEATVKKDDEEVEAVEVYEDVKS